MPHGVCEKPQRLTASALRFDERLSGVLPRTAVRPNARRTMLIPQYIASSFECESPAAVPAPLHDAATACRAAASVACGCAVPDGAAKPRRIAVRGTATPIADGEEDAHFA